MTATAYGNFLLHQAKADIDWDSVSLKALLVDSSYTPNYDTDEFRDDITGELSAGGGYSTGGVALTGEGVSLVGASNRIKFDADDADFGTLTKAGIVGLIVYVDTGSAATDILVSHHTFASESPTAEPFKYLFHADGIGYITY